jgi:hypothetical protein
MSEMESRQLMLTLEAAIDRVEIVSSRDDELRVLQSLNRLIESSDLLPKHSMSIAHDPVLTIEQAPSATSIRSGCRHCCHPRRTRSKGLESLTPP